MMKMNDLTINPQLIRGGAASANQRDDIQGKRTQPLKLHWKIDAEKGNTLIGRWELAPSAQ